MSCPDCFRGSVHNQGTPQGRFETLYGRRTYIAGNADKTTSRSTILYLPDAFGLKLVNNQILADRYADGTGCRVLLPDIIPGGGVSIGVMDSMDTIMRPAGYDLIAWMKRIFAVVSAMYYFIPFMIKASPAKGYPGVLKYARALRADLPEDAKLGVCGFCWGGYGSTNLCTETAVEGGKTRLIDAQFCAHPSGLKTPDMLVDAVSKFRVPYSCAVAEKDFLVSAKVAEEVEALLVKKIGPAHENDYEFVVHKNCTHSFAVRASPDNKIEYQGLEDAAEQAVNWFSRYLK